MTGGILGSTGQVCFCFQGAGPLPVGWLCGLLTAGFLSWQSAGGWAGGGGLSCPLTLPGVDPGDTASTNSLY